eukprot:14973-Pyramimonas_sp.AAC.1
MGNGPCAVSRASRPTRTRTERTRTRAHNAPRYSCDELSDELRQLKLQSFKALTHKATLHFRVYSFEPPSSVFCMDNENADMTISFVIFLSLKRTRESH